MSSVDFTGTVAGRRGVACSSGVGGSLGLQADSQWSTGGEQAGRLKWDKWIFFQGWRSHRDAVQQEPSTACRGVGVPAKPKQRFGLWEEQKYQVNWFLPECHHDNCNTTWLWNAWLLHAGRWGKDGTGRKGNSVLTSLLLSTVSLQKHVQMSTLAALNSTSTAWYPHALASIDSFLLYTSYTEGMFLIAI